MTKTFLRGRRVALSCAFAVIGTIAVCPAQDVAELQREIERLQREVKILSAQVEGTAQPVNLARTRLATVLASSVNGSRPLDDRYYGALNLFDERTNWVNNLPYTYWLSGDPSPWVELRFAVPVTVVALQVEGGPRYSAQLFVQKGGQVPHLDCRGELRLDRPLAGVSRVRLNFDGGSNIKVEELRVLGFAPPGADTTPAVPGLVWDRNAALNTARERFRLWSQKVLKAEPVVGGGDKGWVVQFEGAGGPLYRVEIGADGIVVEEALAEVVAIEGKPAK